MGYYLLTYGVQSVVYCLYTLLLERSPHISPKRGKKKLVNGRSQVADIRDGCEWSLDD